jgi:5'-deoxynucleotidase YfbR-like HD superfamily hydrolase
MPASTDFHSTGRYIHTHGGRFYIDKDCREFKIKAIAGGLARVYRWNGQVSEFISVAEHSVMVSTLLWQRGETHRVQLLGLLHDACEAYIGDVPGPFKALLPDYERLEEELTTQILQEFVDQAWQGPLPTVVKSADWEALYIEARRLKIPNIEEWPRFAEFPAKFWHPSLQFWNPEKAEKAFLDRFKTLRQASRNPRRA